MALFTQDDVLKKKQQEYEALLEQQRAYQPYQESAYVSGLKDAAMASKNAIDNYAPFQFSKQDMYDQLEKSYLNREKFKWDADSDALYQMYKDKYMQAGKLAMQDAMGKAAAMTGGYGNSYAATVGNQAYQSYLGKLNDVIPQLYQLAMDRYEAEGNDMANRLGLLRNDRSTEYGEYTDQYGRLADAYSRNYGLYGDERSREQNAYDTAYNRLADSLSYAMSDYDSTYNRAYTDFRNNIADQQAAASLAAIRAASSAKASKGAGTDDGSESSVGLYTFRYIDDKGIAHYYKNGDGNKDYTAAAGQNPYTGGQNKDAKYGTFSNGYQPDNIGGEKLSRTGETMTLNGRDIQIWKLPDGSKWYWDGTKNAYQRYYDEEKYDKTKTITKDGTTRSYQ